MVLFALPEATGNIGFTSAAVVAGAGYFPGRGSGSPLGTVDQCFLGAILDNIQLLPNNQMTSRR